MTPFEQDATAHAQDVYDALIAAERANPSVNLKPLHEALLAALVALVSHHPGVVRPDDGGTPKN